MSKYKEKAYWQEMELGMKNYNLVIRETKFKQMDVVKRNTTGQHMVKNMSLVVRWVIDRSKLKES